MLSLSQRLRLCVTSKCGAKSARVPDQNGVSQARYIVEICHSGPQPSSGRSYLRDRGSHARCWDGVCLLVGCLTSQQQASVSQGRLGRRKQSVNQPNRCCCCFLCLFCFVVVVFITAWGELATTTLTLWHSLQPDPPSSPPTPSLLSVNPSLARSLFLARSPSASPSLFGQETK